MSWPVIYTLYRGQVQRGDHAGNIIDPYPGLSAYIHTL